MDATTVKVVKQKTSKIHMSWISEFLRRGFKIKITIPWPGEKGMKEPDNYKERKDAVEEILEGMDKRKQGGKDVGTK